MAAQRLERAAEDRALAVLTDAVVSRDARQASRIAFPPPGSPSLPSPISPTTWPDPRRSGRRASAPRNPQRATISANRRRRRNHVLMAARSGDGVDPHQAGFHPSATRWRGLRMATPVAVSSAMGESPPDHDRRSVRTGGRKTTGRGVPPGNPSHLGFGAALRHRAGAKVRAGPRRVRACGRREPGEVRHAPHRSRALCSTSARRSGATAPPQSPSGRRDGEPSRSWNMGGQCVPCSTCIALRGPERAVERRGR